MEPLQKIVKLKSLSEIIERARDLIRRHRRRFLKRNLRPCPYNCKLADMMGHKVIGCSTCGSTDPDQCKQANKFVPMFTKEELAKQFADSLRDPQVLLRDYRDLTVFLWILGGFDQQVDEHIVSGMESNDTGKRNEGAEVLQDNSGNRAAGVRDVGEHDAGPDNRATTHGASIPITDDNRGNVKTRGVSGKA